MKFSTAFSVLAVVALKGFVSASPLPSWADHDLEVRGEAMDIASEGLWARDLDEELEISARAYNDEVDFVTREFTNAIEDALFARTGRAAGQAAKVAGQVLKKAAKDTIDMAGEKVKDAAEQAMEGGRPPVGRPRPLPAQQAAQPKPVGGGPSVPKLAPLPKAQPGPSKILGAVKSMEAEKAAQKAAQKAAAERGAQAIINKQKANKGGVAAAAAGRGPA